MNRLEKIKNCNHLDINWCFSQFNPDFGKCRICGSLLFAYNSGSEILDECSKDFFKIISEYNFNI